MYASFKLRLDSVKRHVYRFVQLHEYAIASSYKMPDGEVKLASKNQEPKLYKSPGGLKLEEEKETLLYIFKE